VAKTQPVPARQRPALPISLYGARVVAIVTSNQAEEGGLLARMLDKSTLRQGADITRDHVNKLTSRFVNEGVFTPPVEFDKQEPQPKLRMSLTSPFGVIVAAALLNAHDTVATGLANHSIVHEKAAAIRLPKNRWPKLHAAARPTRAFLWHSDQLRLLVAFCDAHKEGHSVTAEELMASEGLGERVPKWMEYLEAEHIIEPDPTANRAGAYRLTDRTGVTVAASLLVETWETTELLSLNAFVGRIADGTDCPTLAVAQAQAMAAHRAAAQVASEQGQLGDFVAAQLKTAGITI
jgi:hypothetical protein